MSVLYFVLVNQLWQICGHSGGPVLTRKEAAEVWIRSAIDPHTCRVAEGRRGSLPLPRRMEIIGLSDLVELEQENENDSC